MDAFWQLFYALPSELQDQIRRLSYKTQKIELLQEIVSIGAEKEFLLNFTELVLKANSAHDFQENCATIHAFLGPGLNQMRLNSPVTSWRFHCEFHCTVKQHTNGQKAFDLMSWEQSFAVYFWMCIYH